MQIRCGVDLVSQQRFQKIRSSQGFLESVFQPSEMQLQDKMSGIFALKEAASKALGKTPPQWLEMEVRYSDNGKPQLVLSDIISPAGLISLDCSLSHEGDFTFAEVVLLLKDNEKGVIKDDNNPQ